MSSFNFFRTMSDIFLAYCRKFLGEVDETAFYVSIRKLWRKKGFVKRLCHWIIFGHCVKKISQFCRKKMRCCQNYILRVQRNNLMKNNFFRTCFEVFFFFGPWVTLSWPFFRMFFHGFVRTEICLFEKTFWWKKEVCEKIYNFVITFAHFAKEFWSFVENFPAELSKLHSFCPYERF